MSLNSGILGEADDCNVVMMSLSTKARVLVIVVLQSEAIVWRVSGVAAPPRLAFQQKRVDGRFIKNDTKAQLVGFLDRSILRGLSREKGNLRDRNLSNQEWSPTTQSKNAAEETSGLCPSKTIDKNTLFVPARTILFYGYKSERES